MNGPRPKRRARGWPGLLLALTAAVLALWLGACASPSVPAAAGPDAPATGPASERAPGPALLDGEGARRWALDAIRGARRSVDLEMYELGDPDLVAALEAAERRGVSVRVILDPSEDHSAKTLPGLRAAGVSVQAFRVPGGIDHVKLLVVDGSAVLVGGINWGPRSWENHDWDVAWGGPAPDGVTGQAATGGGPAGEVAAPPALLSHVARDWAAKRPAAAEDGPVAYADAHIGVAVRDLIASARSTLDLEASALSDEDTLQALADAAARGVKVTVVASSQEKTTRTAVAWLARHGVAARFYRGPATLHAKVIVADETVVILGSANFSYHAFHANHELDVRLARPDLARRLAADVRRLWDEGRNP